MHAFFEFACMHAVSESVQVSGYRPRHKGTVKSNGGAHVVYACMHGLSVFPAAFPCVYLA